MVKRSAFFGLLILLFSSHLFSQSEVDHFSIKLGYMHVQHLEPAISGQNFSTNTDGIIGGGMSGLDGMNGLNFKFHYFFNNHLGVYADLEFANSDIQVNYQNGSQPFYVFSTHGDYMSQSIGVAGRFTQEDSPFNAYLGTSVGHFGYNYSMTNTADGSGLWYDGSHNILKFGIDAMVDFEIVKGFNFFTSLGYSTQIWVDGDGFDISYTDDNGTYYQITQNSPSMAAIRLTFGFGYNF